MTSRVRMTNCCLWAAVCLLFLYGLPAWGQAQAPTSAPAPAAATPAKAAPAMDAPLDVKAAQPPSTDDLTAKGDPGGTATGTVSDVLVSDAKKGLTLADVVNQVGQNRIAVNFVWTLICGFLVMFMQAGFAIVETGLCRAKNANHTMMMNFMVYGFGLFAFWVCGFAIQMGGGGPYSTLGGAYSLTSEHVVNFLGKPLAFAVSSVFMGGITYPLFANWAWGGGWLSQMGVNFALGHGYCDFAGSGVVHAVGGVTALALSMIIGPRIGKYNRNGTPNAMPGHDLMIVLTGCFILAFGWFGFNPGSTLAASGNGALRISSIAVNTMLAGCTGSFGAILYMWIRYGKPDASMTGNGLLAGLVAITAPSGFVNTVGSAIIGLIAGVLVCVSVEFVERVLKVDDPVGAISVHGTNGLWGVISVGLFADGTSNYGGTWNGVTGSVRGLFYGDASQLVAQLIGVGTLIGVIFAISYVSGWIMDVIIGQRVSAEDELEGLDIPEMGALCYPEFALQHQHPVSTGGVAAD